MKLHIVYRSAGGENTKARPTFYSKLIALKSLLRSAARCPEPPEIVFVNDGPMPSDRLELMAEWGDIVSRSGLGAPGSHREALEQVDRRGWPDEDVVYLVEDDYLHVPGALPDLAAAGRELEEASYFGLYANLSTVGTNIRHFQVGERVWITADSTTSTFAARIGALRKDAWLHRNAHHAGGSWDRDSCLANGGTRPYPWPHVVGGLLNWIGPPEPLERRAKRAIAQTALGLHAIRRSFAPHLLIGAEPAGATHMTLPYLAPGVDWEAAARQAAGWTPAR